jgi:endonuclease III
MTVDMLLAFPLFSEELSIDLRENRESEVFKWFLAAVLYGGPVSPDVARRTFRTFQKYRLEGPESILQAGRSFLLNPVFREGGYVRHDNVAAGNILDLCRTLLDYYQGSLKRMHDLAADSADLESRLTALRGVEPLSANIFLRELRTLWPKADPGPLPEVAEMADKLKLDLSSLPRKCHEFIRIEAALIRLKQGRRRRKKTS